MAQKIGDAYAEISVRDKAFHAGLNRAQMAFGSFGNRIGRMALQFGATLGAAFTLRAIFRATVEQERVEGKLVAALKSHGDAADILVPKLKDIASAIQKETIVGDESILSLMAQLRILGVMPNDFEKVVKGAIGLSRALDMDTVSAGRYTAMAMQGNFLMLQRYLPTLRTATTEEEKHRIVTDFMRRGYEMAQAEAKTLGGRIDQVKNSFGDASEQIGFFTLDAMGGAKGLIGMRDAADEFGRKMEELRKTGFGRLFVIEMQHMGGSIAAIFVGVGQAISVPVVAAFENIGKAAWNTWAFLQTLNWTAARNIESSFDWLADQTVKAFEKMRDTSIEDVNIVMGELARAKRELAGLAPEREPRLFDEAKVEARFVALQDELKKITFATWTGGDVTRVWTEMVDTLAELDKQRLADIKQINDDTAKSARTTAGAEADAVADSEEKKREERTKTAQQFVGFLEAAHKVQEKIIDAETKRLEEEAEKRKSSGTSKKPEKHKPSGIPVKIDETKPIRPEEKDLGNTQRKAMIGLLEDLKRKAVFA